MFLNQRFPDLHRAVKALTLRKYQRQDFYCTLCERNDFKSIDDLIDHIIPAHTSTPTTVMNTGYFVCTLCHEKKHRDLSFTPPYCFLEAFDLALHVFKFHRSLAEATRMKVLMKMSARVELVTMHRTCNDEHGDDGLSEYLACTDDDVVMYPAANRVEEEIATEPPATEAPETHLTEKPKRGRPKGSKNNKRQLGGLPKKLAYILPKQEASQPAVADASDDDEMGNLVIDEAGSAADIDVEEPDSGRSSRSDMSGIADLKDSPQWVCGKRKALESKLHDSKKETDRDLILHGRAIPPPPYRLKMKKKREELAKAKRIIEGIKAAEMAGAFASSSFAASGAHQPLLEQQHQILLRQQGGQSVIVPQMQQWNFGQYQGSVTVRSITQPQSLYERRSPEADSNASSSSSPPPPPVPEVVMGEVDAPTPAAHEVPTEEDSSPEKLPKKKGGDNNKKRRAQIEEFRRKRIAHRAKKLNSVLHEGSSEDPSVLKRISMHKLLALSTREVKNLRTKEDNLLECKQELMQKKAALQKRLVENQMLERSKAGLQRRLALC